nr:histidine phosphotransferase family protein [Polymorphobacter sp.]
MTTLAALVAMRLTHDLAGPIGAISTGIDLLDDGDPELRGLIADGAASAVASLRLHRFVLAPPEEASPARGLLAAWLKTREATTLDWTADPRDAAHAAILLGLAMCAAEAAPGGGRIAIDDDGVTLSGAKVRLDPGVAAALAGGEVTVSRAALAGVIVSVAGPIGCTPSADGLRLAYSPKA